jgi:hypothetical protein
MLTIRWRASILPVLLALATAASPPARGAEAPKPALQPAWAAEFLRSRLALDDRELARLGRGEPVVRMVRRPGEREIAVLGVVALGQAPPSWSPDFPGIERLRGSNPDLLALGRLSSPAADTELAGVMLERRTLPQLRKCQPRQCALNVTPEAVEPLRTTGEPDAAFRAMLLQLAVGYQGKGDPSLPVLAGRPEPLSIADAPAPLLSRPPSLAQVAPRLEQHFRVWPAAAGSSDVFYWVREKSWKHEVVSLVHASFDEERLESGRARVLAEKTFYANHYLRSALAVTGLLEDASGSYLFYLNRSETDNGSAFNFIERALAGYLIPRRLSRQIIALRESLTAPRAADLSE